MVQCLPVTVEMEEILMSLKYLGEIINYSAEFCNGEGIVLICFPYFPYLILTTPIGLVSSEVEASVGENAVGSLDGTLGNELSELLLVAQL